MAIMKKRDFSQPLHLPNEKANPTFLRYLSIINEQIITRGSDTINLIIVNFIPTKDASKTDIGILQIAEANI